MSSAIVHPFTGTGQRGRLWTDGNRGALISILSPWRRQLKIRSIYLVPLLIAALPATAFAQAVVPPNVDFTASATMPSLKDPSRKDTFAVTIGDAQVKTQLELTCSAGYTQFLVVRSDKACAVSGNGSIVNPSNQSLLPRTQY